MEKEFISVEAKDKGVEFGSPLKYFFLMGEEERKLIANWYKVQKGNTENQDKFLGIIKEAIDVVNYDYYIATIEPSLNKKREIYYEPGRKVLKELSYNQWLYKAKEFLPERGSDLASLYELYFWYAYRVAKGYWTLEYVCDDSSGAGNYANSPNTSNRFERSGARTIGGFADGIGNTCKIVKGIKNDFDLCGGCYIHDGSYWTVTYVCHLDAITCRGRKIGTGCIVLRK